MTLRDRSTQDERAPAPARLATPSGSAPSRSWENLFALAPPARQRELLALAQNQGGLLHAHQIQAMPTRRPSLAALLSGQLDELEPLIPPVVEGIDPALDPRQREAVARALSTPDFCLIQGWPGTGKSRIIREIILQATARGERVLFLAASTAAIDQVLESINGNTDLLTLRCPTPGERPEDISPCLRRLSFTDQLRSFEDQTVRPARQTLAEAVGRQQARSREEAVWSQLHALAKQHQEIAAQQARLTERRAAVADAVATECEAAPESLSPFQLRWQQSSRRFNTETAQLETTLNALRSKAEEARSRQATAATELAKLQPLADAKKAGRWWSIAYWRAGAAIIGQIDALLRAVEAEKADVAQLDILVEEQAAALNRHRAAVRAELAQLRESEIASRQGSLGDEQSALDNEQRKLTEQWQSALALLCSDTLAPTEPTVAAVAAARAARDQACADETRKHHEARQWAEALEQALPGLPDRLRDGASVVAATTAAFLKDPHYGERAQNASPFDLLLIDEAETITDAELQAGARRAQALGARRPTRPRRSPSRAVALLSLGQYAAARIAAPQSLPTPMEPATLRRRSA